MKILLSPSKTMQLTNKTPGLSVPIFNHKKNEIVSQLKTLNIMQLKTLYKISDKLAESVYALIHDYNDEYAAVHYYQGEAYRHLDTQSWNKKMKQQAQDSLRILCAMHGYLKPYDKILPYRMDFLVDFENFGLPSAYTYWSNEITSALQEECEVNELVFNLASKEFSSALDQSAIMTIANWINVDFHVIKDNKAKTVSMLAKKARGQMARALISHPIHTLDHLFNINKVGDFVLDKKNSTNSYLRYITYP